VTDESATTTISSSSTPMLLSLPQLSSTELPSNQDPSSTSAASVLAALDRWWEIEDREGQIVLGLCHHSTVVEEAGGTDRDRNEDEVDNSEDTFKFGETAAVISFIECQPSASLPVVAFPGPVMMILPSSLPRSSQNPLSSVMIPLPISASVCLVSLFFLFCFVALLPFSPFSLLF
jgi:hypothetical protein